MPRLSSAFLGLIWCCSRRWDPVLPAHSTTLPWTHPDPLFSRYMNRGNFMGDGIFLRCWDWPWFSLEVLKGWIGDCFFNGNTWVPPIDHVSPTWQSDAELKSPAWRLGIFTYLWFRCAMVKFHGLCGMVMIGYPTEAIQRPRGLGNLLKFLTMVHMVFPKNRALKLSKLSNGQSNHPC